MKAAKKRIRRTLGIVARATMEDIKTRGARLETPPAPPEPRQNKEYPMATVSAPQPVPTQSIHAPPPGAEVRATREKPPTDRESVTRTFRILGEQPLELEVVVGLYADRRPCELFMRASTVGSLASGAFDGACLAVSLALQHGAPLRAIASKWVGMRFEPAGFTGDAQYPIATSVMDLVGRWLIDRFCTERASG